MDKRKETEYDGERKIENFGLEVQHQTPDQHDVVPTYRKLDEKLGSNWIRMTLNSS